MRASARLPLLLLGLLAGMAGAQEDEGDGGFSVEKPFNIREALAALARYDQEHPGFITGVAVWIAVGAMIYIVALAGLLYSEIRTCLIVRDQDFRVRLLETQACVPGSRLADLKENENALLAPRAYIAFICLLLFVLAIAAMLFPLCDIFTIVGECERSPAGCWFPPRARLQAWDPSSSSPYG